MNRRKLTKNAAANLARGAAGGMVALLLPPFLVRHMQPALYAVWVLVLQTAAYASFLDFGLQVAVGRYIAYAEELADYDQRDTMFSTAFLGLVSFAILSGIFLVAVVTWLHIIFPAVPRALLLEMRWALLLVGASVSLGLPASAWNGVFFGLQRNEIPALTTVAAKFCMVAGIVAAVYVHASFLQMASVVAFSNLLAYILQYGFLRRLVPGLRFRAACLKMTAAKTLFNYCAALSVMSFAMLLVNGFDLLLVGHFDFTAVVPYSVAAAIVPLIAGGLFAIMNAMMPQAAALHARGDCMALGSTVISSTRIGVLILVFTGCPLLIFAGSILRFWIGGQYVVQGEPILVVLLIANMVRLIGAAYSVVLVAAAQQGLIKISPVAEGVSNFVASIALGATVGGIGVAYGTLLGAIVGVGSHLFYSMPRTRAAIDFSRRMYLISGIAAPLLSTAPLLLAAILKLAGMSVGVFQFGLAFAVSLVASAWLLHNHHKWPKTLQET